MFFRQVFRLAVRSRSDVLSRKFLIGLSKAPSRDNLFGSSRTLFTMKIETPEFKAILTEEVAVLQKLFVDNGFEIRIAGGAVRDLLLGIQPKDLDFATTATPSEMKAMFTENEIRMINMAGEKHGTITPRINDKENFEVTTLRVDVVTDGRRAEVEFVKDWKLDANRRDLTINSMFLGLDGMVYDYFNGYEDLLKRRVVFVGDAATRIKEDYLRILRYFRFYGRIAANSESHDAATLEVLTAHCSGLDQVSGERIWVEVYKTLEGNFGAELIELMVKLGIAPHIGLPEECALDEFHSLCSRLKAVNVSVRPITLLCGLLSSTQDFMLFHQRCKLSKVDRDLGLFVLEHRDYKGNLLKPYQMLVICSTNKYSDVRQQIEQVLLYRGQLDLLQQFRKWDAPKFPINGNMVRENCQTANGVQVGKLLNKLKAVWAEKDFTPTTEELLEMLPSLFEEIAKVKESKKQKIR